MQVRRLETTLDRSLFQRTGRGVQLTPHGEALLGYARRLLKLHDEALAVLTRPDLTGFIRLGTPDDYVERFLPDILVRFARAFPRVQVEVHCEPSVHLRRCLAEDRLDLALITCAPGAETGEVLRREPTVWATAERHLAHEQDPLPLALFQPGCPFRDWALAGLGETGRPYRVAYTSASITGLFAAVTAAAGQHYVATGPFDLGRQRMPGRLPARGVRPGGAARAPRSRGLDGGSLIGVLWLSFPGPLPDVNPSIEVAMERIFFIIAAGLAGLAVALDAWGAHGLPGWLDAHRLTLFETGVRYQMYHALALLGVSGAGTRWPSPWVNVGGWLLISGVLVFSGSLYLLSLTGIKGLGTLTPLGGLLLLAGWGCLAVGVWRAHSRAGSGR